MQKQTYDRIEFVNFLRQTKNQELETAKEVASFVGTFLKSGKAPEDFILSYEKPNSYNNALNCVKHYCDFLGLPRPMLKQKPRTPTKLIVAPKLDEVLEILQKVEPLPMKTYLALCSTVGLRPQRLLKASWHEIDFESGFVNINEKHGKKVYRPNPLHKDVAELLRQLKQTSPNECVFSFAYGTLADTLKAIGTKWRPNNLRDFFYNTARKYCDHDQIEWAMGHSLPGVRANYLADELKQEYAKFEAAFTFADGTK
jgi:integrase